MTPPAYSTLSDDELFELLDSEQDGLERAAADEFISRGARMIPRLSSLLQDPKNWTEEDSWRQTHAALILGAIGGDAAIPGLIAAVRHSQTDDFTYDDLNEDLPWIFASIGPAAVGPLLRRMGEAEPDSHERRDLFWALGCIAKRHPDRRPEITTALRAVAENPRESLQTRACAGSELLDFARPEDRDFLLDLGRLQKSLKRDAIFFEDSVIDQYEKGPHLGTPPPLDWLHYFDPVQPELNEESFLESSDPMAEFDPDALREPVRAGRNDPCPCGSGKKYKKCCEGLG